MGSAAGTARQETEGSTDRSGEESGAQQCLQSDGRAPRQYQRWPAHTCGKTGEARQEIKIIEAGRQAQGKLNAVTHD